MILRSNVLHHHFNNLLAVFPQIDSSLEQFLHPSEKNIQVFPYIRENLMLKVLKVQKILVSEEVGIPSFSYILMFFIAGVMYFKSFYSIFEQCERGNAFYANFRVHTYFQQARENEVGIRYTYFHLRMLFELLLQSSRKSKYLQELKVKLKCNTIGSQYIDSTL